VLAHQRLTAASDDVAQDQRHDNRVIELTGDRDEVGHEVDRDHEVRHEQRERQLAAAPDARVAQQAPDEHDAVGNETRERPRVAPPAERDERQHAGCVDGARERERGERPLEGAHRAASGGSGWRRGRPTSLPGASGGAPRARLGLAGAHHEAGAHELALAPVRVALLRQEALHGRRLERGGLGDPGRCSHGSRMPLYPDDVNRAALQAKVRFATSPRAGRYTP
jgi:hypothetical protein